jgi:hypothetical protein
MDQRISDDWPAFTSWDGSLSLQYPPDWRPVDPPVSEEASLSCLGPGRLTLLEAFGMRHPRLRGRELVKKAADLIAGAVAQDRKGHSHARLLRRQSVSFRNAEHRERIAASELEGGVAVTKDYFIAGSSDTAVSLALKVQSHEYSRWRPMFEQVIETLSTPWLTR